MISGRRTGIRRDGRVHMDHVAVQRVMLIGAGLILMPQMVLRSSERLEELSSVISLAALELPILQI